MSCLYKIKFINPLLVRCTDFKLTRLEDILRGIRTTCRIFTWKYDTVPYEIHLPTWMYECLYFAIMLSRVSDMLDCGFLLQDYEEYPPIYSRI
jgi:hypothetical protein